MQKKYLIVQVHLQNECAEDVLTSMLKDWDWEFVCCVAPKEDLLVYTFKRDLMHGGRQPKQTLQDAGIRKSPDLDEDTPSSVPAPYMPDPREPVAAADKEVKADDTLLTTAVYHDRMLLKRDGKPVLIRANQRVKCKTSSTTFETTDGCRYSLITGNLLFDPRQKKNRQPRVQR